ncbi:hypothetical protein [Petrocella sp. FN5]|uniref:hypothetical protein n=1 Tax=Petrocella sp. FN5 TaxID=3032002 RepID=UPI0023DA9EB9|nr:hypothetical protein [Petrocella sp. FN5]MDF1616662.1 hypothetical protein [Petrocella sp. FN5]
MKRIRIHENHYYVGVDFGHHTVSMSALEHRTKKPVMLDRTGGYGQIYVPAKMVYLVKEATWLIGEEAVMMHTSQDTIFLKDLLSAFYERKIFHIESVNYESETLIAIYISELLKHLENINPNSMIKGLTITLPDRVDYRAHLILKEAVTLYLEKSNKGLSKLQIHVISNSEAMLAFLEGYSLIERKQCYFMDFGHEAFRVYDVHLGKNTTIRLIIESKALSGYAILEEIEKLISTAYLNYNNRQNLDEEEIRQIQDMCKTYYSYILKAYQGKNDVKITYKFAHPPFQAKIYVSELTKAFEPIESVFEKQLDKLNTLEDDYEVVVMGNGFRNLWPKYHLQEKRISILVEDLDAASKGASLWSLKPYRNQKVNYIGRLKKDYGVMVQEGEAERFLIIAQSGSHYASDFTPVGLIMVKDKDLNLKVCTKDAKDKIEEVTAMELKPQNSEAIFRVTLKIEFDHEMHLVPTVFYDEL